MGMLVMQTSKQRTENEKATLSGRNVYLLVLNGTSCTKASLVFSSLFYTYSLPKFPLG